MATDAELDPIVALQHQRREAIHDLKGNLALLRNSIFLFEREPPRITAKQTDVLLASLRVLEREMTHTVRIYEPEFEIEKERPAFLSPSAQREEAQHRAWDEE